MNQSFWMYFFMILGILGIVIINIFSTVLINNEQNYYLLKEVTEAAMYDAVDTNALIMGVGWDSVYNSCNDAPAGYPCIPEPESMHCAPGVPGTVRIIREKFIESFSRRLAESADLNRNYRIIIHDLDECPPKVSVTLIATERFSFVEFFNVRYDPDANIRNQITAILESKTQIETTE